MISSLPKTNNFLHKETPYPMQLLKQQPWYEFTRHNGYAKLAKRLMLKVFSGISEIEMIWDELSSKITIFDQWEVRRLFYDSFGLEPYFLALYEQNTNPSNILGVLPLWLDDDEYKGKYTWYGSYWPEENSFYVKELELIPLMLMAAPSPTILHSIRDSYDYDFLKKLSGYAISDKKYYLDITKFKTTEDYLSTLKKKKRYNIRRDRKKILLSEPKIVKNDFSHLQNLIQLSMKRQREKFPVPKNSEEENVFEDLRAQKFFRMLSTLGKVAKPRMISTIINGEIQAVEFGMIYKNIFYAFISGANVSRYPGLGVFSNLLVIEDALQNRCEKVDFFEGDYNWKDSWHLNSVQQYEFKK